MGTGVRVRFLGSEDFEEKWTESREADGDDYHVLFDASEGVKAWVRIWGFLHGGEGTHRVQST
jgi:hypothetical protein